MSSIQELQSFLNEVESSLLHIQEEVDEDTALLQSQWLLRGLVEIEELLPSPEGTALINCVLVIIEDLQHKIDMRRVSHMRGRPCIPISEEQLSSLLEHHYTITDIARLLLVSPRTIRRRVIQYNLEELSSYSNILDSELDDLAKLFVQNHPNLGQKSFEGFLRSCGIKIQRSRVRDSLMRVDPFGVQNRFRHVLRRRQYSVAMPNSLWHLDGHHKLIRWHIIVHGGIDGFSRLPVFIEAANNNRASTVLDCFLTAVQNFGLPSRIRTDKGQENTLVSRYMLEHPNRGPGRGSCITGRSVHNQRIERFWRDLFHGCISLFYTLFYSLEDTGELNPDDPVDLFCLHYVYIPRLNQHLKVFQAMYSHHRLRGSGNKSPYQLWLTGMVERNGDEAVIQGVDEDMV